MVVLNFRLFYSFLIICGCLYFSNITASTGISVEQDIKSPKNVDSAKDKNPSKLKVINKKFIIGTSSAVLVAILVISGIKKLTRKDTQQQNPTMLDIINQFFRQYPEYVEEDDKPADNPAKYQHTSIISYDDLNKNLSDFNKLKRQCLGKYSEAPHIQKVILNPNSKVCFFGDIHGSAHSLFRSLLRLNALKFIDIKTLKILDPSFYIVFLGDYQDRGKYSAEVLYTLLNLKLANTDRVFLLRGNHESINTGQRYGFFTELSYKYPKFNSSTDNSTPDSLLANLSDFYNNLPYALYLRSGNNHNWIQCCHGGIDAPTECFNPHNFLYKSNDHYMRLETLQTQDGHEAKHGFVKCNFEEGDNITYKQSRGYKCGLEYLKATLQSYGVKSIFRGHQHFYFGLKLGAEQHWIDLYPDKDPIKVKDHTAFTFSTASEGAGLDYDCFGILQTAENYADWILTPYEFTLNNKRNNKYVHIWETTNSLPTFEWHDQPQAC